MVQQDFQNNQNAVTSAFIICTNAQSLKNILIPKNLRGNQPVLDLTNRNADLLKCQFLLQVKIIVDDLQQISEMDSNFDKNLSRLNWTAEEQIFLKQLKEVQNIKSWTLVSKELNRMFEGKNRSGKQCRERYMNYVRFSKVTEASAKWTPDEDELLFRHFLTYGRKWVEICKLMAGKSENCLKNRFYGAIRKILRRMLRAFREQKQKCKKKINQNTIMKVLEKREFSEGETNFSNALSLSNLKNQLINLIIVPEQNIVASEVIQLTKRMQTFASRSKTYVCQQKNIFQNDHLYQGQVENIQQSEKSSFMENFQSESLQENSILLEKEATTIHDEEVNYLKSLGLELNLISYPTINYDLEKQMSEILREQYIQPMPQLF